MKSTVKDELNFSNNKNAIFIENVQIYDTNQNIVDANNINNDNDFKDFGLEYEENEDNNYNHQPILSINNNEEFFSSKKSQKESSNINFMKSSIIEDYNKSIDYNCNAQPLYKTN